MFYKKNQAIQAAIKTFNNAPEERKVIVEYDYSQRVYFIHVLEAWESTRHLNGTIIKTLSK